MLGDILIALLVVGAVGVLSGVVLTLASHFFSVPEDETEKKLRECLPGVNCGACGYTGCDEYAKALATGETEANLCVPGSTDTAEQIAKILGIEVSEPEDLVAVLKCNGTCDAANKSSVYSGVDSCKAASMIYGGPNMCKHGCVGCGDCANICPVNAISIKDCIAHIDTRICIGCGVCAKICPKDVIELVAQERKTLVLCNNKEKGAIARKACTNACIACRKCENSCPNGAIKVIDNLATIDFDKCTNCGICADVCPTKCIHKVDLYTCVL